MNNSTSLGNGLTPTFPHDMFKCNLDLGQFHFPHSRNSVLSESPFRFVLGDRNPVCARADFRRTNLKLQPEFLIYYTTVNLEGNHILFALKAL